MADCLLRSFVICTTARRPRHRWVDNIRMDLGEVGWGDVDWICLAKIGTGGEL
jgi:hypothetical protein